MKHQEIGVELLAKNPSYYGLACEQGTGKTWMLLCDAERLFKLEFITGLLVIAPNGVHSNWVRKEIPTHLSVPVEADYYVAGAGVKRQRKWERLFDVTRGVMKVFAINVDALNTKQGYALCQRFLAKHHAMMAVDESSRIKTPSAGRTKKAIALGRSARSRRIMSGTMMPNGPKDLFSQFDFLRPGLLGTKSFRAFVAEYTELQPEDSPLVRHAMEKSRAKFVPQIPKTDSTGKPIFKNLGKLSRLIEPYVYRVKKEDCIDLPPKIYTTRYFELPPAQRKVYETADKQLRYEHENGMIDKFNALTKLSKLRQITSCFIMLDGEPLDLMESNPRLNLLEEILEDVDGQFIVWAYFKAELRAIAALFKRLAIPFVSYHGEVSVADRERAIDDFQSGKARAFIGNPQAAATGLTLTAASTAIYYSNDFNLELRLQSEDRCHRIGTKGDHVLYIDLCAVDTKDEQIAARLQAKEEVAAIVMDGLGK
jgi:SNF2 family DNA or RNA helicase